MGEDAIPIEGVTPLFAGKASRAWCSSIFLREHFRPRSHDKLITNDAPPCIIASRLSQPKLKPTETANAPGMMMEMKP